MPWVTAEEINSWEDIYEKVLGLKYNNGTEITRYPLRGDDGDNLADRNNKFTLFYYDTDLCTRKPSNGPATNEDSYGVLLFRIYIILMEYAKKDFTQENYKNFLDEVNNPISFLNSNANQLSSRMSGNDKPTASQLRNIAKAVWKALAGREKLEFVAQEQADVSVPSVSASQPGGLAPPGETQKKVRGLKKGVGPKVRPVLPSAENTGSRTGILPSAGTKPASVQKQAQGNEMRPTQQGQTSSQVSPVQSTRPKQIKIHTKPVTNTQASATGSLKVIPVIFYGADKTPHVIKKPIDLGNKGTMREVILSFLECLYNENNKFNTWYKGKAGNPNAAFDARKLRLRARGGYDPTRTPLLKMDVSQASQHLAKHKDSGNQEALPTLCIRLFYDDGSAGAPASEMSVPVASAKVAGSLEGSVAVRIEYVTPEYKWGTVNVHATYATKLSDLIELLAQKLARKRRFYINPEKTTLFCDRYYKKRLTKNLELTIKDMVEEGSLTADGRKVSTVIARLAYVSRPRVSNMMKDSSSDLTDSDDGYEYVDERIFNVERFVDRSKHLMSKEGFLFWHQGNLTEKGRDVGEVLQVADSSGGVWILGPFDEKTMALKSQDVDGGPTLGEYMAAECDATPKNVFRLPAGIFDPDSQVTEIVSSMSSGQNGCPSWPSDRCRVSLSGKKVHAVQYLAELGAKEGDKLIVWRDATYVERVTSMWDYVEVPKDEAKPGEDLIKPAWMAKSNEKIQKGLGPDVIKDPELYPED